MASVKSNVDSTQDRQEIPTDFGHVDLSLYVEAKDYLSLLA